MYKYNIIYILYILWPEGRSEIPWKLNYLRIFNLYFAPVDSENENLQAPSVMLFCLSKQRTETNSENGI